MFRGSMLFGVGILGLALLVGTSDSQEKKDKAKGQLPAGWKELNLTAAQKEKVYEINAEFKKKADELNKELKKLSAEQKKAQVAVLTDEQKELLQKLVIGDTKKKDAPKDKAPAKEKAPEKDKKTEK